MGFEKFLFYVFALVLVFAAVRVITVRNPVHAALFLVLAFFTSAALWLLIEAEFLAIVLVLVYVGAVMVLFLFVIMMLDINVAPLREGFIRNRRNYGFFSAAMRTSRTRSSRDTRTCSAGFWYLAPSRRRMVSEMAAMIATNRITEAISNG